MENLRFLLDIKEKERNYVTLDNLKIREFANKDPEGFLKKYAPPVIIDEVQYATSLLPYIKIYCDSTNKRGLFWLTGSQKIEIMKNVSETLVGRMGILTMDSFSYREITKSKYLPYDLNDLTKKENITRQQIIKNIFEGGMPGYLFVNVKKEFYFDSYVKLYLERDIRELKEITDLVAFNTFLVAVASRACKILNCNNIARECGKDEKTIKSWISVLEATGVIKLIYPYRKEELKRLTSSPKIIFMDSGLCTYLCSLNDEKMVENYTNFGFLFENYLISEMIKINENHKLGYRFMFYKDKDGRKIDLIVQDKQNILHPYEIKSKNNADISMISTFKKLSTLNNVGSGGVICLTNEFKDLIGEYKIIPIGSIIS